MWRVLAPYLAPSTTELELPHLPIMDQQAAKLLWPTGLTSLTLRVAPTSAFLLPATLQTLRITSNVTDSSIILAALPQSITHLEIGSSVSSALTNWPPSLRFLRTEFTESGAGSMQHLPSALEHLRVGRVPFDLAEFLPSSVKRLEAIVENNHVPSLLKRAKEIGCVWITNQEHKEIDLESPFRALVASCRASAAEFASKPC